MTEKSDLILEQRETIKLEKNSKGYNWEIKLCIPSQNDTTKAENDISDAYILNRLKSINEALLKEYGSI